MDRQSAVLVVKQLKQEVIMFVGTGGREASEVDIVLDRLMRDKKCSPESAVNEAMRIRDSVAVTH